MVSNTHDYQLLHGTLIEPEGPNWRELMLDLGAPLVEFWHVSVWVTADRLREDSPYDVSETVALQDHRRLHLGETEPTEEDLELFAPVYTMRERIFLFDHKPTPDEVPPISPILPGRPFIEIKHSHHRDTGGAMSFRFEGVPPGERQEQFLRHLQWWHTLAASMGVVDAVQNKKQRIPRIPQETFLNEGLAAAEVLARKGKEHLYIYELAAEMRRDRETISNAAQYPPYRKEWEEINKKFSDTRLWLRMNKKP